MRRIRRTSRQSHPARTTVPPPCSRADAARPTLMLTATRHRSTRTPQHVCTQHSTRKHTSQHGHTYRPTHSADTCTHKYAHVTTHSTDTCAHSTRTHHNTGTPTTPPTVPTCVHTSTPTSQHTAQTRVHTAHTHNTGTPTAPPTLPTHVHKQRLGCHRGYFQRHGALRGSVLEHFPRQAGDSGATGAPPSAGAPDRWW